MKLLILYIPCKIYMLYLFYILYSHLLDLALFELVFPHIVVVVVVVVQDTGLLDRTTAYSRMLGVLAYSCILGRTRACSCALGCSRAYPRIQEADWAYSGVVVLVMLVMLVMLVVVVVVAVVVGAAVAVVVVVQVGGL